MEELAVAASEPDELERLLARIQAYNPQADAQLIRRAYEYSARMHAEQKRESGEPYVTHPLNVALIIAQLKLDLPSIITGLLHDVDEQPDAEQEQQELQSAHAFSDRGQPCPRREGLANSSGVRKA